MAHIAGNLWEWNMVRVIVIDVTDDYRLMQPPLPSECYPILEERLLPRHNLDRTLPQSALVEGYLYDWHETTDAEGGEWYVGVVDARLANELLGNGKTSQAQGHYR